MRTVSSIEDRVILVMIANELALNVNAGNTNDLKVLNPAEGNQPSLAANTRINIKPNQKFGIDTPINAATIDVLSRNEYCRVAEITPSDTPITMANSIAQNERSSVFGNLAIISLTTGLFVVYDFPKSPTAVMIPLNINPITSPSKMSSNRGRFGFATPMSSCIRV